MRINSFAKINLGLEVLRKRKDGFHEIRTLFQSINYYDQLDFHSLSEGCLTLEGTPGNILWDETNLIYRAAALLKEGFHIKMGAKITVDKHIPSGGGLGGGSSNAAATLYALNKLWSLGLSKKELMDFGSMLGSDVPYFLEGGLCMGEGKGEIISSLSDLDTCFCILVFPDFQIQTASVYEQHSPILTSRGKDSKIIRFLGTRDLSQLENGLEDTIFRLHPQIKEIKSHFHSLEPELSLVSGTGSTVFGLFQNKKKAQEAFEKMSEEYSSRLVETLTREAYWKKISAGV